MVELGEELESLENNLPICLANSLARPEEKFRLPDALETPRSQQAQHAREAPAPSWRWRTLQKLMW